MDVRGGSHSQSSLKRKAMMNNSCVVRRGGGSFVIDVSECVGYHVRLRRREPFLIAVVLLQTFENAFSAWKRERHI